MLTDTELDQLARAVAALGDEDAGRLEGAVRERRRAKAEAEVARIAALRAMDDHAVIDEAIRESVEYPERWESVEYPERWESDVALQVLRDAGFVRQPAQPAAAFHFNDVPIWTMADGTTACGSWEEFCHQVASCARGMGPFEASKLLAHVAALVPEETRDTHRAEMLQRLAGRRV